MRWLLFLPLVLLSCQVNTPDETAAPVAATPTLPIGINLATRVRPTTAVNAASLLPTPTPLPPPTITPAPTPIIHIIQAGDTLLDLAIQQGVTVADIEALNPDLRPELLQVGQQVVLPPVATAVLAPDQATAVPPQLTIAQLQLYQMPSGAAWVVGEVFNEGELAAESVQVAVSLLAEGGEVVGSTIVWVAATIMQPQTKAPFGVVLPAVPAGAQPAAVVASGQTLVDAGSRYLDLAVEGAELGVSSVGKTTVLNGTLHNSGDATAAQIRLVATLYDQNETIIGFVQHDLEGVSLAAGEQHPFSLALGGMGETAVFHTILAEAQQQP